MRRRDVLRGVGGALAAVGPARARPGTRASVGATPDGPAGSDEFAPLGSVAIPGTRDAVIGPDGSTAYLAVADGFAIVDVDDPTAPRVITERRGLLADRTGGPLRDVQDVAVDGDRLLVVGPAHRRSGGLRGAALFDVRDPAEPALLAVHETEYPIHNATLVGDRAYLTANDGGRNPIEVVDMADEPIVVGDWSPVDADPRWREVPSQLRIVHDVWVREGLAYLPYWDAGTWIVNLRDPASPTVVSRAGGRPRDELAAIGAGAVSRHQTELPGNHHYAATDDAGELLAVGAEAWALDDADRRSTTPRSPTDEDVEGGPGGIDLWDVTDPTAPALRSTIEPPPTPDPSLDGVWTTAHNFDVTDGRLYSAWYQGGVRVHDVRDPETPQEVADWRDASTTRFWTAHRASAGVVASSMGVDDAPAGLYTFPDPAEERATPSPTTASTTRSRNRPRRSTGSERGRGMTTVPGGQAGFGALAALLGAGFGGVARRRE